MRYKNTSASHVRISENKMLAPGAEIDLDEDEVKQPEIKSMIKNLQWLTPVLENVGNQVVGGLIQGEIDHMTGNKPGNTTNNFNFQVNIPIGGPKIVDEKVFIPTQLGTASAGPSAEEKQKIVDEAVRRASQQKRQWNPMDDMAPEGEPDFTGAPKTVNTAIQYGNAEIVYDLNSHPVTHMGGTSDDDADTNNTGTAGYVPHHPEDLSKYNAPVPEPSKSKMQKGAVSKRRSNTKKTK